ncbi:N-acetyl-D-Glu racemase DgcA [Emcibacter nanhaiensis]|nr:N-acetyl-D-Glu racemase DgcA [Emcibacter nanhaiensis]
MNKSRNIAVLSETWELKDPFVIAHGTCTETRVVVVEIRQAGCIGRGEGVPTGLYGETVLSVVNQIREISPLLKKGLQPEVLLDKMPPGAARNAVDCALWDLRAKLEKRAVSDLMGVAWPQNITSVQTVSIGSPKQMGQAAAQLAGFPVLKIKLDAEDVIARLEAVHGKAPGCGLLIDANESWTIDILEAVAARARELNIVLIEQPLPAGQDSALKGLDLDVPIGADESCHTSADLGKLAGLYDVINIKLDKAGGLTEAMNLYNRASRDGFQVMVGCMLGTSLSIAPAMLIAQFASYVDLDSPALLRHDCKYGLSLNNGEMSALDPRLWGGVASGYKAR